MLKISKIDSEQIIDILNFKIEINKLICKICYCVLINPKICYNKKCKMICCTSCLNNISNNKKIFLCPFCKAEFNKNNNSIAEYTTNNLDSNLIFVLNNLKIICKHIKCKNKIFNLNEYFNHMNNQNIINENIICSSIKHKENENDKSFLWKFFKNCEICNKLFCKNCNELIINILDFKIYCKNCIKKNNILIENNNNNIKCFKCKEKIDEYSNPFNINKCSDCKELFCNNCSILCPICKEYFCFENIISCSNCSTKYLNSYQCKKCNISNNIFITNNNNNNLCLNCIKTCNACSMVLNNSSLLNTCSNCEENVCSKHIYVCNKCNKNNNKKICLKNCTYTCYFCFNKITSSCNKNNHFLLSKAVNNCSHQICENCIDKCSNCKYEQCQLCINKNDFNYNNNNNLNIEKKDNYYDNNCSMFICKFCNKKLCYKCSNFCFKCYKNFCPFHNCLVCDKNLNECSYCFFLDFKMNCSICESKFNICEQCANLNICSYKCYALLKNVYNNKHICQMFICNNCIKEAEENLKNDENNNNNNNISINNISYNSDLTEILNERTKRKKIIFDKVNMNCKETTVCIIF